MNDIFQILVPLIVAGLVYYLILQLPIPEPFMMIIRVVVILALIVWLLQHVGGVSLSLPGGR